MKVGKGLWDPQPPPPCPQLQFWNTPRDVPPHPITAWAAVQHSTALPESKLFLISRAAVLGMAKSFNYSFCLFGSGMCERRQIQSYLFRKCLWIHNQKAGILPPVCSGGTYPIKKGVKSATAKAGSTPEPFSSAPHDCSSSAVGFPVSVECCKSGAVVPCDGFTVLAKHDGFAADLPIFYQLIARNW